MRFFSYVTSLMKLITNKQQITFSIILISLSYFLSSCQQTVITTRMASTIEPLPSTTKTLPKVLVTASKPSPTYTSTPCPLTPVPKKGILPASPLKDIDIEDLSSYITNKYSPPPNGSDNPHQGVDFSIIDFKNQIAIPGNAVQAVFDGIVAAVIHDRFPYGNAILIETNLENIDPAITNPMIFPTPAPIRTNHPVLTCPNIDISIINNRIEDINRRSLYLLYAHLDEDIAFKMENKITKGEIIGKIGSSGNALNPHLHLELRVGQPGFRIPSMAHYDPSASEEEMGYYCLWRISDAFQLMDPMILFTILP